MSSHLLKIPSNFYIDLQREAVFKSIFFYRKDEHKRASLVSLAVSSPLSILSRHCQHPR